MDINNKINNLFTNYFYNITNNDIYVWENIKPIFENIMNDLNSNDKNVLLKKYYFFTILYINYTNYLKFIKHSDFNNTEIYEFIKIIKFNKQILNNIIFNLDIVHLKKIFKIFNPFISSKLKKNIFLNKTKKDNIIEEYVKNSKQFEKIFELSNNNYKKSLNIIIYRFLLSQSIKYENYHEFYINKILDYSLLNNNNLEIFLKQIPNSKDILNLKINSPIPSNLQINIKKIIDFFKSVNPLVNYENKNNDFIFTHIKYNGTILLSNDIKYKYNNECVQFNYLQQNLSLFYFNIKELSEYTFLKKSNNFIVIYIESYEINDLSILLNFIHILTISFKILETYPTNIYEILYPLDYSNYYYKSFCNFFQFIKNEINSNLSYNKFIIDIIKYYYIYSYYDFYFYYSTNLLKSIVSNFNFKNKIAIDFFENLKKILKLPNELYNHPPFVNVEDDVNNLLYYSYEIPNYFKFFDFINALCNVNSYEFNNTTIIKCILKFINVDANILNNINENIKDIKNNNENIKDIKNNNENIKDTKNNNENIKDTKNNIEDIKSNINDNNSNINNKKLFNNNNTFIELDIENSVNCIFNTEK